jgi:hypothetical protein
VVGGGAGVVVESTGPTSSPVVVVVVVGVIVVVVDVLGVGRSSIGSTSGVLSPNAPAATWTSAKPSNPDAAKAATTPMVRRREDRDMRDMIVRGQSEAPMRTR